MVNYLPRMIFKKSGRLGASKPYRKFNRQGRSAARPFLCSSSVHYMIGVGGIGVTSGADNEVELITHFPPVSVIQKNLILERMRFFKLEEV